MVEKHYGKAMVAREDDTVTITSECNRCGRTVIGPIHATHLRSIIEMLATMADHLGVPESTGTMITEKADTDDPAEAAAIKREFESMPIAPLEPGQTEVRRPSRMSSAWSKVKEVLH